MSKMSVHNDITGHVIMILFAAVILAVMSYAGFSSWLVCILVSAPFFWIAIQYWIAYGREIVFSAEGISISFLFIKKQYSWKEYPNRYFLLRENQLGYRDAMSEGIEFSRSKHLRPKGMLPGTYCFWMHPFSYVFVSFPYPQPKWTLSTLFYAVDSDEIYDFLESIDIDIVS